MSAPLRRACLASAFLASLVLSGPSRADEAHAAVAEELFNTGKELERNGDIAAACPKFAESATLDPRVGTFARLASCNEKLGNLLAARMSWQDARSLALRLHDPRAEHAASELARVDAVVPKLSFSFVGPPPADLDIAVDAEHLGVASLGVLVPVEAGTHAIRATAAGKRPMTTSVTTKADGAVTRLAIELVDALPGEAPPAPPPSPEATPVERAATRPGWSARQTTALVVGGVGLVGVGVGSYFGVRSFQEWSDAKAQCGGGCGSGSAAQSTRSDAQTSATVSTIAFAAGGAALLGAAILWFTAPRGPTSGASAWRVDPTLGVGVAGITVSGELPRGWAR